MNLPTGTELVYIIGDDAWYAEANRPTNPHPYLSVEALYPGDGCEWEFTIIERELQGSCTQVRIFQDAYAAFVQVPELFQAFADEHPTTLAAVVAILDELGAKDITPRVNPYA